MLKQQTSPILPSPLILLSPLIPPSLPILPSLLILLSLHNPPSLLILPSHLIPPSHLILPSLLISPTARKNKQKNAKNNFFIIFAHIQKTRNL